MSIWTACALGALLSLGGCAGGGHDACKDGVDNDGDGLIDGNDPACAAGVGAESPDPVTGQCDDGADNYGDGLIDFPDDPGCTSADDDDEYNPGVPACSDGIDNDADGLIDYPVDPGCFLASENDETDDCPNGANCPACANGEDDDGDGLIDFGIGAANDPGCDRAADDDEFNATAGACGSTPVTTLPADGIATGRFIADQGTSRLVSPDCGGTGPEVVYGVDVTRRTALLVSTDFAATTADTVVYVRSDCQDPGTEVACDDDAGSALASSLQVVVDPGVYYIVVDAHDHSVGGDFELHVDERIPEGDACDSGDPRCAPGLVCRLANGSATSETCEQPECNDGDDDDGDGAIDFPDDPGCADASDNDESTDDCALCSTSGCSACPACGNGVDDDGDGAVDYPDDPGCAAASGTTETDECIPGLRPTLLGDAGASGTTSGTSKFAGSCTSYSGGAPEDVYAYTVATDLLELWFSLDGSSYDTVLYVRGPSCGTTTDELACEDTFPGHETVTLTTPVTGQSYFVFVDGYQDSGAYQLSVGGTVAAGGACDPASATFACAPGNVCKTNICTPKECSNGTDDDADGLVDFLDPGCIGVNDDDESDDTCVATPSSCPQCANGSDDDGDGAIDYPADLGCVNAADDEENACAAESDPIPTLAKAMTSGDTSALTDDFSPSCQSSSTAPDQTYYLYLPGKVSALHLDTTGSSFDTVLMIKQTECASSDYACNDDDMTSSQSALDLTDVPAGLYVVIVDGYQSEAGPFTLNTSGTIAAGERCDPGQPFLGCASGTSCTDPGSGYVCN